MKRLSLLIIVIIFISSCSSYLNGIYRQLDRDQGIVRSKNQADKFAFYRKRKANRKRFSGISNENFKQFRPAVVRKYVPSNKVRKRYTASDLNDNGSDGSLWTGQGKDSHLFSTDKKKQIGDIVTINVFSDLKKRISMELKRAFPKQRKKKDKNKKGASKAAPVSTAATAKKEDDEGNPKVFDKISSIIIEQINKDHLLIRGRKNVIFRNRKRTIEVQGLASRTSIANDETIDSTSLLESYIDIIR